MAKTSVHNGDTKPSRYKTVYRTKWRAPVPPKANPQKASRQK